VEVQPAIESKDTRYVVECRPDKAKGFTQRTDGILRFADKPEEAPIVHFGGPLTLTILDWHRPNQPRQLVRGADKNDLSILVGTPVFGGKHEAFATVFLERFDEIATVEVAFPSKEPDAKPIVLKAAMRYCE
jgi:hypothetical protein